MDRPSAHPSESSTSKTPSIKRPEERRFGSKYGPDGHLLYHEESGEAVRALRLRDLVHRPVIRQWVEEGKLYREPAPREVPRFELFFDLLFVAIIHQLADAAIEEPGGDAVARFVLTFWPSWSIWEEARKYSNQSGTDDLLHRFWILIGMACILGYSVNASAIELHPSEEENTLDSTAVRAAVAFYLVIKLTRVLVLFLYSWRLPLFRIALFLSGLAVLVPMFFYLPLIWVIDRHTQIILASLAIFLDLMRIDHIFFVIYARLHNRRQRKQWASRHNTLDNLGGSDDRGDGEPEPPKVHWLKMAAMPKGFRLPGMNIEHVIERSGAFVVIVLGELVMNLLYTASGDSLGASPTYGKAVLGLMVAWALNWIYALPMDVNNEYEHALRRSWATGISFTFFHWPLCASLVLASAASGKMVASDEVEVGVHWYWGCGLGFGLLFMALIDQTHRNLLPNSAVRIPRPIRFIISLIASLALILFPLGTEVSSTAMMAIAVGITWFVVAVNVFGVLPRPGSRSVEAEDRGVVP